jgi:hypothetical protein
MVLLGNPRTVVCTLLLGFAVAGSALAQVPAPATSAVAEQAPATAQAPASEAPAAKALPAAPAAPPGYMLVPINDQAPETRYDVQYPQARGALPPGMELPYEDGDAVPAGYRLRHQPRRGLLIAGSIVTGVPWVFSVTGAVGNDFEDKSGFLLVPAIGPWLMLAAGGAKDEACPERVTGEDYVYCGSANRSGLRAMLVLDGLAQTAGAVMFTLGIAYPRKRLVRSDVTVSVLPAPVGRDGYGLGAIGTF